MAPPCCTTVKCRGRLPWRFIKSFLVDSSQYNITGTLALRPHISYKDLNSAMEQKSSATNRHHTSIFVNTFLFLRKDFPGGGQGPLGSGAGRGTIRSVFVVAASHHPAADPPLTATDLSFMGREGPSPHAPSSATPPIASPPPPPLIPLCFLTYFFFPFCPL